MQEPTHRRGVPDLRNFQCPRTRLELHSSADIPAPPPPLWRDVAANSARNSAGNTTASLSPDSSHVARIRGRSRGSRGRGSQQRRREARSAARAAQSGQRDCDGCSSVQDGFGAILGAIQAQGLVIQELASSVAQMAKSVNSFLFANRRTCGLSAGARFRSGAARSARAAEELRPRAQGEWERLKRQADHKLVEIQCARLQSVEQMELGSTSHWDPQFVVDQASVAQEVELAKERIASKVMAEYSALIDDAIAQEQAYEKCVNRRTNCKALQDLVASYNATSHGPITITVKGCIKRIGSFRPVAHSEKVMLTMPQPSVLAYQFDVQGRVAETYQFWIDPGRFWSYDLVQVRNICVDGRLQRDLVFSERPL